jgi:hypothetical protein
LLVKIVEQPLRDLPSRLRVLLPSEGCEADQRALYKLYVQLATLGN